MRSRACGGPVRKAGGVGLPGFGSVFGSVPANAAWFRGVLKPVSAWANALCGTAAVRCSETLVMNRSSVRFRQAAPPGLHVSVETIFTFGSDSLGGWPRVLVFAAVVVFGCLSGLFERVPGWAGVVAAGWWWRGCGWLCWLWGRGCQHGEGFTALAAGLGWEPGCGAAVVLWQSPVTVETSDLVMMLVCRAPGGAGPGLPALAVPRVRRGSGVKAGPQGRRVSDAQQP